MSFFYIWFKNIQLVSDLYYYTISNSLINTAIQQNTATLKRLAPHQAEAIPVTNAKPPEICDWVEFKIAGKAITAKVT